MEKIQQKKNRWKWNVPNKVVRNNHNYQQLGCHVYDKETENKRRRTLKKTDNQIPEQNQDQKIWKRRISENSSGSYGYLWWTWEGNQRICNKRQYR